MSEPETSGIGTRLRAARERRGLTREALAFHSGVSWSAIAQIESGRRRNVRPDTLTALTGPLQVTLDYIVHGRPSGPPLFNHCAFLYDTDEEFVETGGPFLAEGCERGEAVLVVVTKAREKLLREYLGPNAHIPEFADSASSWYGDLGSALNGYGTLLTSKLEQGAPWIRVLAEATSKGQSDPEIRNWLRYESLVNLVFAAWPVTFLCTYDRSSLHPEIVRQAQATHPHTVGQDGITSSPDYGSPSAFVLEPE